MSRFSKAAAEQAGWSFYHKSEEVVLRDGDNELGISKKVPASLRAEKFIDLPGQDLFRTTEEAPTLGLLLERIHSFEQHLEGRLSAPNPEVDARNPDMDAEELAAKQKAKALAENESVAASEKASGEEPGKAGAEDEDLELLPVSGLKKIAKSLGISSGGRKAILIARIKEAKK